MEFVIRIFGSFGRSVEKRVGNFKARDSGVMSRFVLVVEWIGLVALSVGVILLLEGFLGGGGFVGSVSLAESIMLSHSSSNS